MVNRVPDIYERQFFSRGNEQQHVNNMGELKVMYVLIINLFYL